MRDAVVVTDVATARQAITTIIEQGEGTTTSPEEGVGNRVAHYYRFLQIQKGRLLEKVSSEPLGYAYAGPPVHVDASGIYAVATNPAVAGYPAGSVSAFANDNFNYTYTSLLLVLHGFFNGENSPTMFNRALGLMMSLKGQAKAMMSGIPDDAVLTGPSFQYQPVNPALGKAAEGSGRRG
jgi:Ferritin-like